MAGINISSISNNQVSVNLTPKPEVQNPKEQKIEPEIKAEGAKKVGEQAFYNALRQLERLLEPRNVTVSTSLDSKSGLQQVKLTDKRTGNKIAEMPPDAVIQMAEKSKQHHIGWLIDRLS